MVATTLNNQAWQPAVGPPDSLMSVQASEKIRNGDFLHLPYLSGTNVCPTTLYVIIRISIDMNSLLDQRGDGFQRFRP